MQLDGVLRTAATFVEINSSSSRNKNSNRAAATRTATEILEIKVGGRGSRGDRSVAAHTGGRLVRRREHNCNGTSRNHLREHGEHKKGLCICAAALKADELGPNETTLPPPTCPNV